MTAHLLALLALLVLQRPAEEPEPPIDWPLAWTRLAQLEGTERGTPGSDELAAELARLGARSVDRVRGSVLAARVDAWAGRPTAASLGDLAPEDIGGLDGEEAWLLAEVAPAGSVRVQAVLRGLGETPELTREQLLIAWNTAVDEARTLRLARGALPIQRILHERYRADWSAIDLSLTLARLGQREEQDELFAKAVAREEAAGRSAADLWSRWGTQTLGFGDEERARDYLGRALARGSADAGLVLGLLHLERGELGAARNAFRPSILSERPSAWALRGWGTSLLPGAKTLPATERRPDEP